MNLSILVHHCLWRGTCRGNFLEKKEDSWPVVAPYTLHLLVFAHSTIFLLALYEWSSTQLQTHLELQVILGVSLVGAATVCRSWSIATLGPYHSIHIELERNND